MGWVGLVYNMLWVGLGLYFGGLGSVRFQKVDPCPCLVWNSRPPNLRLRGLSYGQFRRLL